MSEPLNTKGPLVGTGVLQLALYWWVVVHFQMWTLGVVAFLIAMLLNAIHLLLRASK